MADNRKRHYTSAETLAFVQGDMDITRLEESISQAIYPDIEPDEGNTHNPTISEINAEISCINEEFDQNVLQDVTNTISSAVDFINSSIEDESDDILANHDIKRRRKSTPKEWQNNISKKQRSLGKSYFGKKLVDGVWPNVEKPAKKMGTLCSKETCKNSKKRH